MSDDNALEEEATNGTVRGRERIRVRMKKPARTNETAGPERKVEMARALRAHLAAGRTLREQGYLEKANSEDGKAAALLEGLTSCVAGTFERYARAAFRRGPQDLAEDAVQQMFVRLCERVRAPSPGEDRWGEGLLEFNSCLKRLMHTAVRDVRRRNGMDDSGCPKASRSLDEPIPSADGDDEALTLGEQVADPAAEAAITRAIGPHVAQQLLAELPQNQRSIFADQMNDITWEETARRAGVSVSTAQKRFKEARATLLRILSQRV